MGEVYWLSQRLVCTCCDLNAGSAGEIHDDHILYMTSLGLIEEESNGSVL